MKKVAPPPPPPPEVVAKPPPLTNGSVNGRRRSSGNGDQQQPKPLSTTPGEDCAFDELLEGCMDLDVVLPDCKVVRMTVDRRTPMMDLLVQATTSNKISPGGHIINVISKDERNLHYKPNTPIGSLDAGTVYIVPKSTLELPVKRMPKLANQPFEQTFRLQVNLPHNQRMVLRVSPRITLAELKTQICSEKELDHSSHHLVRPAQPDTVLDLNATLEVYGCAEISLMSNSGLRDSIRNTSTRLFAYPTNYKPEEERTRKGILRLFSRKKKDFAIEVPANGVNTLPNSQSESAALNKNSYQPKQSIKRKPAPAPPPARNSSPPLITQSSNSLNSRPESEVSVKTADEIESSVSHSRHSSDSSGYHEPSVFSDCSENKSPEASIVHGDHASVNEANRQDSPVHKEYIDSSGLVKRTSMTAKDTNLKNVPSCSSSNISIISASRKRKAPQPPVLTLPAIESPSSPDVSPLDSVNLLPSSNVQVSSEGVKNEIDRELQNTEDSSQMNGKHNATAYKDVKPKDTVQQETEALQYLEDVLQESENCVKNFSVTKTMDDSDTDSQKDEGEVISVCQAEIHANANDQDSSDSVVEPCTVVTPDPVSPKSSATPLLNPTSHLEGCEVVDMSADDSGISQSLNSDADSSVPSINSDFKTMSDSGCQEEIYCNVTDSSDTKSVPSNTEFPAESNSESSVKAVQSDESHATNSALSENYDSKAYKSIPESDSYPNLKDGSVEIDPDKHFSIPKEKLKDFQEKSEPVSKMEPEGIQLPSSDSISNRKNSVSSSVSSGSTRNSIGHTPRTQKKLENFALGYYKKDDAMDIYGSSSEFEAETRDKNLSHVNQSVTRKELDTAMNKNGNQPDVKIMCFNERNKQEVIDSSSQQSVQEKCAYLNNMSTLPLAGRSSSLYDLIPQKTFQKSVTEQSCEEQEMAEGMKRTQSDQNLVKDLEAVEFKESFLQEQKRLQDEYRRLQQQFISWQKQLLSNQSLLQSENIVPQMPFLPFEGLKDLENSCSLAVSENQPVQKKYDENGNNYDELKTRSLPRPKTKPLSVKEPTRPKTPIPQTPAEASVVDIDINTQESVKRPESLNACSVNTQVSVNQEDKVIQVPSPQDKVTSSTQAPSPENARSKEDVSAQTSDNIQASSLELSNNSVSLSSPESDSSRSQTLPRPKPNSALQPSQTMTLNRNTRPKSHVVSVTIGSWQQRQTAISDIEPSTIASSRSKFQSLENIPQHSSKPVSSTMERRKLPPVPSESEKAETDVKTIYTAIKTKNKQKEAVTGVTINQTPAKEPVKLRAKTASTEVKTANIADEILPQTHVANNVKVPKAAPKKIEGVSSKEKLEIRSAAKEPTASFKPTKPFVKLTSMKDESHPPSIIGLKKWPLSDISESSGPSDGRQSILDDLRASSKRPAGFVQDKIRRAEVDLRKPKSSKADSSGSTKVKESNTESSKLHITKVNVSSAKGSIDLSVPIPKQDVERTSNTVTTTTNSTHRFNTIPKSQSLNSELMSVFSKKSFKDSVEKYKQNGVASKLNTSVSQAVTVNGSTQQQQAPPPPPPPPPQTSSSTMPTIPPAEQIPVSSQLLMAGEAKTLPATKKGSKKSPSKLSRTADPREELMLEIRGFGGKQALRKAPSAQPGWYLKVFGTASTANT